MTAGGVVAGIVIVTQIAGYGAKINFVDHMELLNSQIFQMLVNVRLMLHKHKILLMQRI